MIEQPCLTCKLHLTSTLLSFPHKGQGTASLPRLVLLVQGLRFLLPTLKTKYEFVVQRASFCPALTGPSARSCDVRYNLALSLSLGNPAQGHNLQTRASTAASGQPWDTTYPSTGHPDTLQNTSCSQGILIPNDQKSPFAPMHIAWHLKMSNSRITSRKKRKRISKHIFS